MRSTGLRATQHSLLRVIQGMGTVSIGRLAEAAVMDRTTLARNLDLLEREGLVRVRPGEDARVREVMLTEAAERRLVEALPYWEQAQRTVARRLGHPRLEQLLRDLTAVTAVAQE